MNYLLTTVFILVYCSVQKTIASDVLIEVNEGTLRCEILKAAVGNTFYSSCKGIPYAQPPVGPLRFRAPQPVKSWQGIWDATQHSPVCPQVDILSNTLLSADENCLSLNIYSPNLRPRALLPVIVFLHAGFFQSGSGNSAFLGPDFLVNENVILVTLNYRIGPLGFLNLGIPEVPGNAGMKDQVLALKWIKNNIAKFGGNPNSITLQGSGAGAASVGFHMISPLSRGLFQRAVLMSGTPLNEWAVELVSKQRPYVLAQSLGFRSRNPYEVLAFLKKEPAINLVNTSSVILAAEEIQNILQFIRFTPVVEDDFGQERFLTESCLEALAAGHLNVDNILIGYTNEETLTFIKILEQYLPNYIKYKEMFVPSKITYATDANNILTEADRIIDYYYGNKTVGINSMREYVTFANDYAFIYDIHRFVNRLPSFANVYLYKFGVDTDWNYYNQLGKPYGISGAAQYDDLLYLFYARRLNRIPVPNTQAYNLIRFTNRLFSNFARYGNPTPDWSLGVIWPSYDVVNKRYLGIYNRPFVGAAPDYDRVQFWRSIFEQSRLAF